MQSKQGENPQLTLAVKVNPFQSWLISTKKAIRHIKYSPVLLLIRNFLFWVQLGIVFMSFLVRILFAEKLQVSFAVLNMAASTVQGFVSKSVRSLAQVDELLLLISGVTVLSWIVAVAFYSFGKQGIVPYVLVSAILIILLLVKIIVTPILLLGIN